MKSIIITGANGFIGSSLLKKLLNLNVQIVAIDIGFSDERVPDNSLVTKIVSSLDDEEALLKAIPVREYDAFYHFAWRGVNGLDKADPRIQIENSRTTIVCASVAKKLNCGKFLCAGTVAEQATHSLPKLEVTVGGIMYGVAKHCTHLMLEAYCKNVKLPFVWMQFSNIYGPSNKTGNLVSYTIGELVKGNYATFGPACQPYDFIYIDDLLEAIVRLGEYRTNQNTYFIGSGNPRILKDYLQEIGVLFGREDLIQIGVRPDDCIEYRMDMFDNSALVKDIGEYVSMSFTEGIRKTIEEF